MSIYLLATINIHDRDTYGQYESGFMEVFEKFKGRLLAVDEDPEVLEGHWSTTRTVLIEFPTVDDAHAWYHSTDYQQLMKHRQDASTAHVVLLHDRLT